MNLTPVNSSHIAAIGYLEEDRVLLVRYKSGSIRAWPDFQLQQWYELQSSASKGGWLNHHREFKSIDLTSIYSREPRQSTPLQSITPDEMRKVADSKQADCGFSVIK